LKIQHHATAVQQRSPILRSTWKWVAACMALAWLPLVLAQSTPDAGYREPADALKAIVDAPRAPNLTLGPKGNLAALTATPGLPGIATVAEPELRLGGLRIHPAVHAQSQFTFSHELWLLDLASGQDIRIDGLPAPLAIAEIAWSPDQRYLAFRQVDFNTGSNALWVVDVATRKARALLSALNTVNGAGITWMPDSRSLLLPTLTADAPPLPAAGMTPNGPAVQDAAPGQGVRALRTYQDLLRNAHDAQTLEHYLITQLVRMEVETAQLTLIGEPGLYLRASPSPDGRWLLTQRVERPFSYLVPLSRFPRVIEVIDAATGTLVHEVARLPLVEGLPTGNDAVPAGVRSVHWRADASATLVWAEALDGGDPGVETSVRDAVFMHAAPFKRAPVKLIELGSRLADITWGHGDLALVDEFWWKTRQTRTWRVQPDHPRRAAQLLFERSSEDRYADPGRPATRPDAAGRERLLTSADGRSLFLLGQGASPEGERPFVDRYDLKSGHSERLFHSRAPYYEVPQALLDEDGQRLLITRESPAIPPNFHIWEKADDGEAGTRALTDFPHPTPHMIGVSKEQIRYRRSDGVELTATLYLPPGYDIRGGRAPVLMWAYPREFKTADAASQVTGSPWRFNQISYWGPLPFLARGFVVLDNPSMPIIGEGDADPNDTYIEQLVASAQAAVDEVVRRGIGHPEVMAIGGHSYGAFMTANLLAHSRLFKAGIARSGAYNRTLTPFGFQAEERNYWQAQSTYLKMSPFNYADRIEAPLLLIHGENDNNAGTFPIQSERLFAAIKGLGGTARLVMLPSESHGYRARESVLHMLAETDEWLTRHLRLRRIDDGDEAQ